MNKDKKYIYYRDALEYLRIIFGVSKLTKAKRKILEKELREMEELREKDIQTNIFPRVENIKHIYKATIYEYESGRQEIAYECNKDNNKECNKRNCSKEYCNHTLNKKYAKEYK